MKTRLFIIATLALISHVCLSQDLITYKNGQEEKCKVTEVTNSQIKFRREDNPDGPVYSKNKSAISTIKYANGNTESFEDPSTATAAPVIEKKEDPIYQQRLKFSGPRIGFTIIGSGEAADKIQANGKTPFVTQFGWQFETRIFTLKDGASGLLEFVPLVAGIEQGMFLPSFNMLFGIRGKKGNEFAFGPNLSLTGAGLVLAVGTSFHTENVYFPINLAVVPSVTRMKDEYDSYSGVSKQVPVHTGVRVSLLIGFNTRKR